MKRENFLLEALQTVLPKIAENAEKCEQERKVPEENIQLLKSIGLHKAFLPKAYGGYEISLPEFSECITALAGACGSTAWAFSLLCTHNHQLAMFPKELQDEIWGDNPDAVASSSIAPFSTIEEVEGGIRLSGKMGWSSGVDHADWAIVGCNRINENGEKVYSFAVLPKEDYEIVDNWYALAMKGSGSKLISIDNVFIPEYRIQAAKDMMEGRSAGHDLYPDSKVFYAPYKEYPTRATLAEWRTNQAYCVKMCIAAVDRLMDASGASVWMEGVEIQRLFRDMHITGAHAYTDYDVCAQILGRELMGLEPDPTMV